MIVPRDLVLVKGEMCVPASKNICSIQVLEILRSNITTSVLEMLRDNLPSHSQLYCISET